MREGGMTGIRFGRRKGSSLPLLAVSGLSATRRTARGDIDGQGTRTMMLIRPGETMHARPALLEPQLGPAGCRRVDIGHWTTVGRSLVASQGHRNLIPVQRECAIAAVARAALSLRCS
jgi:hypothetical protein